MSKSAGTEIYDTFVKMIRCETLEILERRIEDIDCIGTEDYKRGSRDMKTAALYALKSMKEVGK